MNQANVEAIAVGNAAPDFSLPSIAGEMVTLSHLQEKQNVIVYFMRAFT